MGEERRRWELRAECRMKRKHVSRVSRKTEELRLEKG